MRTLICLLALAGGASAQQIQEHESRLERSTPGLVPEMGGRTGECDVLKFVDGGLSLIAAGDDKVVRTWGVDGSGKLTESPLPVLRWPGLREQLGVIYTVSPFPDGRKVLVGGFGQNRGAFAAAVIDRKTGNILHGARNPENQPQVNAPWSSDVSPSGMRAVLGTNNGFVLLWDFVNPPKILGRHKPASTPGGLRRVYFAAFADEQTVLTASSTGELLRWSIAGDGPGTPVHQFNGTTGLPISLSPDRKWMAYTDEGQPQSIQLLSFPDGVVKRRFHNQSPGHRLDCTAFSADGKYLAVSRVKDAAKGFLLNVSADIQFLDLAKEDAQPPIQGPEHTNTLQVMAFHPTRSALLATAGGDNHEVIVWDLNARKRVGESPARAACPWSLALSPDGDSFAFQTKRNTSASHPNRIGDGPWTNFDLAARRIAPSQAAPAFEPSQPLETLHGWTVSADRPNAWYAVSPAGNKVPIPLDRDEVEFPRCYSFVPGGSPERVRLVVGHYWGCTLFDCTAEGLRPARVFRGHDGFVAALSVSRDGKRLVTAGRDMTVNGWAIDEWEHHPQLGAELFARDGGLRVGAIAAGSPIWETGLETGDELVHVAVPEKMPDGSILPKVVYERTPGQAPAGTPQQALAFLNKPLIPNSEHRFYWKTTNAPQTVFGRVTTLVDRPLWRFFADRDGEWILWRWRDFAYDSSSKGDSLIGWQRNYPMAECVARQTRPDFYKAEQFREAFRKPADLAATLEGWKAGKFLQRFNEVEPPVVKLSQSSGGAGGHAVTATFTAKGLRENQDPKDYLVWLNDYLVEKGAFPVHADRTTPAAFTKTFAVPADKMRAGRNVLTVQCYSRGGARAEADPVELASNRAARPRAIHAVLAGVGDYQRSRPRQQDLNGAGDALALANALKEHKGLGPNTQVNIVPLRPNPRRAEVLAALDKLRDTAGPDDLVIVFLGGHGLPREALGKIGLRPDQLAGVQDFLFLLGDFNVNDVPNTTIGFDEIHDRLYKIPGHKFAVIDACHAGQARGRGDLADPVRILTRHGVGCTILMSCKPDEVSQEISGGDVENADPSVQGFLMICLNRMLLNRSNAFSRADGDGDSLLNADELTRGVRAEVSAFALAMAKRSKGIKPQNPVIHLPDLEKGLPMFARQADLFDDLKNELKKK